MSNSSTSSGLKLNSIFKMTDVKSMMSLTRSTMKGFKSMIWLGKLRFYAYLSMIVSILVLLGYFVFKHMFYRRVRLAQISYLVRLDPVNRDFSETVANTLFVLLRNTAAPNTHLPTYEARITKNALFYEDIPGVKSAISNISKIVSGIKDFSTHDYKQPDAIREDDHLSQLVAVVNKRFVWSRSQKMGTTKQCDALFEELQSLVKIRKQFEEFVENRSLLNFVDKDHLDDPSTNETLRDYGAYLDPPLKDRVKRFSKQYENPEAKAKLDALLQERPEFAKTSKPDLKGRLDQLFALLRHQVAEEVPGTSGEDMENYYRYMENKESGNDSLTRDYSNARYENFDPEVKRSYDTIAELHELYEALEQKRYKDLFGPLYHGVESFLYNSRVMVNGESNNVFPPEKIETGMRIYQTFLDELYTLMNMESIDLAVDLTLHLMLDPDPRKEEKLDNVGETYVAIVNGLMFVERNLQRLMDYNRSRHPDPKYAMKMYKERLKTMFDFQIIHMVSDQWKQFLKMREPEAYKFTIHWIRQWMSVKKLIKMIEPFRDPTPEEIEAGDDEFEYDPHDPLIEGGFKKIGKAVKKGTKKVVKGTKKVVKGASKAVSKAVSGGFFAPIVGFIESIVSGIVAIPAVFAGLFTKLFSVIRDVFGDLFKYFKKFIWMLGDFFKLLFVILKAMIMAITDPFKLIELFARLLILIVLLPVVILYNIPIGKLKLAELLIYPLILLFFTVVNIVLFLVFCALTVVFGMGFDVSICRGRLYPLFYRYFIAVENSPSAWYEIGGYHGKNRNERILLAFRECGDNYIPDPHTAKLTCLRKMEGEPKFCPQANIYRVYKNLGMKTPFKPREFVPDMQFLDMNSSGRRRQITKYKKMKLRFYEQCDEKMHPYDDVVKNICRNVDFLEMTNTQKYQIKALCYETYCRNGRREQFCHKMTPKELSQSTDVPTTYVSRTLFLSGSVVFLACVVTLIMQKQAA